MAWSSMLTWAREKRSTRVTPSTLLIRRTMALLSGRWRKISMSAVWSGARNGPGSATAWAGSRAGLEVGAVGPDVSDETGGVVRPVDGTAAGSDEPSPQDATSSAATINAAHATPRRPRVMVEE